MFNESYMCCGVLALGQTQAEEVKEDKENDGEDIVLPGESGYGGDSGWENLGEGFEDVGEEENTQDSRGGGGGGGIKGEP